jgi:hypothetical protein
MGDWLARYRSGEYETVWAEMQALGEQVRSVEYLADAQAVARETMGRARRNVETLLARLQCIGYAFAVPPPPAQPDWALELRLTRALEYAAASGGEYRKRPWEHPALAWVNQEEALPPRFARARLPLAVFRQPAPLPESVAASLSLAHRAWCEIVGSVDFRGGHPYLGGAGMRMEGTALPPDQTAGAEFVAGLRRTFQWGGFPAWEQAAERPDRELDYLRKGLEPL